MLLQRKEAEYFSNYLLKICFRTFRTAFISVLSLAIQNFFANFATIPVVLMR